MIVLPVPSGLARPRPRGRGQPGLPKGRLQPFPSTRSGALWSRAAPARLPLHRGRLSGAPGAAVGSSQPSTSPARADLGRWRLKTGFPDSGPEFQTNGTVERAERTILEKAWRPAFARSLVARYTVLSQDLRSTTSSAPHRPPHPRPPAGRTDLPRSQGAAGGMEGSLSTDRASCST